MSLLIPSTFRGFRHFSNAFHGTKMSFNLISTQKRKRKEKKKNLIYLKHKQNLV